MKDVFASVDVFDLARKYIQSGMTPYAGTLVQGNLVQESGVGSADNLCRVVGNLCQTGLRLPTDASETAVNAFARDITVTSLVMSTAVVLGESQKVKKLAEDFINGILSNAHSRCFAIKKGTSADINMLGSALNFCAKTVRDVCKANGDQDGLTKVGYMIQGYGYDNLEPSFAPRPAPYNEGAKRPVGLTGGGDAGLKGGPK
jgi:hypothetical protein